MSTTRILVVDDNAVMLDAISQMLRREGYEVFPAAGARQALEIVKNNSADLVLSDIVLRRAGKLTPVHSENIITLTKVWNVIICLCAENFADILTSVTLRSSTTPVLDE